MGKKKDEVLAVFRWDDRVGGLVSEKYPGLVMRVRADDPGGLGAKRSKEGDAVRRRAVRLARKCAKVRGDMKKLRARLAGLKKEGKASPSRLRHKRS